MRLLLSRNAGDADFTGVFVNTEVSNNRLQARKDYREGCGAEGEAVKGKLHIDFIPWVWYYCIIKGSTVDGSPDL
jgi:hypothetical protein